MDKSPETRYSNFDAFLRAVIEQAKIRSDLLVTHYNIRNLGIIGIILRILVWGGFPLLLTLSIFVASGAISWPALLVFLASPPGLIFVSIFGVSAGSIMWITYRDRQILKGVIAVGRRIKPSWELLSRGNADAAKFDVLFQEAVVALLVTPEEFYANPAHWNPEAVHEAYRDYFRGPRA